MADPKQTVETIRAFLRTDTVTMNSELAAVAADFAEMCRDANVRLSRCADFLHEGLRGEAIEYANTKPSLMDLTAALDFKELVEWERLCGSLGLPRASRLALDTANSLREAVKDHEPLRELLQKHRYLALARAPLADRLALVRQLIAADPANKTWKLEANELEQARLATLRNEAAAAIRAGETDSVNRLLDELNAGPWQNHVPAELKETLQRTSQSLNQAKAIADLKALVPRVREAYAAMSYDECQQVFSQWAKIVKGSTLQVPPELRQEIMPLARWIDEQDERRARERQFQEACGEVKMAAEAFAPADEINRLYTLLAAFEMDIPQDVASACKKALADARHEIVAEKKRQYALSAILVAAVVCALAVLTFVIYQSRAKH